MPASQMYVPYKISIADILYAMRDELPYGRDIDMTFVMMEILQQIFFDRVGQYGRYVGMLGSFQVQCPAVLDEKQLLDLDVLMHEYMAMTTDVLAATFPSMVMQPTNHYFLYPPGETDLLIYVPVTEDLPPEISSKALPEEAIRNSIR